MGGDTVTLRLNKEEKELFESVAKMYDCSISSAIKRLAIEKIEDDIDLEAIRKFENKEKTGKTKIRPIEELWKAMDDND